MRNRLTELVVIVLLLFVLLLSVFVVVASFASGVGAAPAPVLMGATFTSSTSAAVSWQQPANVRMTCLLRYYGAEYPAGICWENLDAGPQKVTLPGELTHPAYRPAFGDRYELRFEDVPVGSATLGEATVYTLYVPLLSKQNAPEPHLTYLPALQR
jgi:hypothetical protein